MQRNVSFSIYVVLGLLVGPTLFGCHDQLSGGWPLGDDVGSADVSSDGDSSDTRHPVETDASGGDVDSSEVGPLFPDREGYVQLSSGSRVPLCALGADGRVDCWGQPEDNESPDPSGHTFRRPVTEPPRKSFRYISVHSDVACGVTKDKSVLCWGPSDFQGVLSEVPDGEFLMVDGDGPVCGIKPSGRVRCWGFSKSPYWRSNPEGLFQDLYITARTGCGLRRDGRLTCWGCATDPNEHAECEVAQDDIDQGIPPEGRFRDLSGSGYCAVGTSGEIVCWPGEDWTTDSKNYRSVSNVFWLGFTCGITTDSKVRCRNHFGAYDVPDRILDGDFIDLAIGGYYVCGLRAQGSFDCWGHNEKLEKALPDRFHAPPKDGVVDGQ